MSVAPNAGIIDFGTFTPPAGGQDGIQGQVPAPLSGQAGYVLTGNGWSSLGALGVISYQGTWNAATNNPTITSGVGTQGYYYVVSVAGTTNIDGISSWGVGDWIIFNGSVWQKIDSGSTVDITGGQINNTLIGNITPSTGTFTTVGIDAPTTDATFTNDTGITGWVYSNKSFSVGTQDGTPQGVFFRPNGTEMFVVGSANDRIYKYTLGTAWDVSTASFSSQSPAITQDSTPIDLYISSDGLTVMILGNVNDTVYQYSLSVAWDVTTLTYASKSFSVTTQEATPSGMWFRPDGSTMYIVGTTADTVFQYTLSTPWDISTASYANISFSIASQEGSSQQVNLSSDGTKMWVAGNTGDDINEYTLGTAWNISTATFVNNVYIGFQETGLTGLFIDSTTANRVYIVGSTNDTVYQYNTATNTVDAMTDRLFVSGEGYVDGNTFFGSNVVVDGTFGVQGSSAFSTTSVSGTLTASSAVNFSTTTSNISVGTAQTTGLLTLGGTTQTGALTVGQSTGAQTLNLGTGATTNATTKTINIGTAGVSGSTTTINIGSAVSGALGNISMGNSGTQFLVSPTASAVNYAQVTGAATGSFPAISAQGSDSNIGMSFIAKGSARHNFFTGGGTSDRQFSIVPIGSAVNYLQVQGGGVGTAPVMSTAGSDTNISQVFQSKGTGAINLAPGSSGVNISNGGTVTAITRTAGGTGYTSIPTNVISAPTTAGGVQATASITMFNSGATIASGGTGYTLNDVLTVVGGTPAGAAATLTVSSVSAGVITGITVNNFGSYTALPTNPVSVTGGTGSSATFNLTYGVNLLTVTNAGSGYVEQPTVTFSGGGGSGAAAYATVGGDTTVRTLGTNLNFFASNSNIAFRIYDSGGAGVSYWAAQGGQDNPFLWARGNTNASGRITSNGTGSIQIYTNAGSQEQFRVAHIASAVNYVQVAGAPTTGQPVISAQGSDASIGLTFRTKGNFFHYFQNGSFQTGFEVSPVGSGANYLRATSAIASSGPVLSSQGTDTNIDLNLTTKGTGAVNLNTGNGTAFKVFDNFDGGTIANSIGVYPRGTTFSPFFFATGSATDIGISLVAKAAGNLRFLTGANNAGVGGIDQLRVSHTASAVNYVQVTGAATGSIPSVSAQGSDTNIALYLTSKGSGAIRLSTNQQSNTQLRITHTANSVNFVDITGGAANAAVTVAASTASSDTNVDLALTPKGTGLVQFGTHTATALTISGYIEIKDAGGTIRKLAVVT